MDEEAITKLFTKLLNAMNQNFLELTASFNDKLNSTIESVETKYKHGIESRDKVIAELIQKNEVILKERDDLKESMSSDRSLPHIEEQTPPSYASVPEIYYKNNEKITEWNEIADDTRPSEKIDLLVIGDSCVKHLDVNRLNPRGNNKLICKRGGKIRDIRDALMEEVSSSK